MKIKTLFVLISLVWPVLVFGQSESPTVSLKLPDDFFATTCPVAVWNGTKVFLKSVQDGRNVGAVGEQQKGNGESVLIGSEPPLVSVIQDNLKRLLTACGLKMVEKEDVASVLMFVRIEDFYVRGQKKLLTGKTSASSRLLLSLQRTDGTTTRDVEVGYEIADKGLRRKDIRQSEKILNELLANTLAQIPKTEALRAAVESP